MTELTDRGPQQDDPEWLVADEPTPTDEVTSSPPSGRRTAITAAGLVAAGLLVGGVAVAALRPHTTTTNTLPAGFAGGQVPNGQVPNGQPGQGFAGPGGATGELRVDGTVVSVGTSSVRIRTASGTASYGVTSQTEIVRNGALASLSAVKPGDSVFVHLIPSGGNAYVVERLFDGTGGSDGDRRRV